MRARCVAKTNGKTRPPGRRLQSDREQNRPEKDRSSLFLGLGYRLPRNRRPLFLSCNCVLVGSRAHSPSTPEGE